MIWAVALAVGIASTAGLYLALSRDVFHCALGLSILGSAANLLVFAAGRLVTDVPPLIGPGQTTLQAGANPLPQALVLTAIVIGFALTCFSLVLVVRLVQANRSDDALELRHAEPVPTDPLKPPVVVGEVPVAAPTLARQAAAPAVAAQREGR